MILFSQPLCFLCIRVCVSSLSPALHIPSVARRICNLVDGVAWIVRSGNKQKRSKGRDDLCVCVFVLSLTHTIFFLCCETITQLPWTERIKARTSTTTSTNNSKLKNGQRGLDPHHSPPTTIPLRVIFFSVVFFYLGFPFALSSPFFPLFPGISKKKERDENP